MGQWVEMHKVVMEDSYHDDDIQFSVNPSHGKDPFGWMSVIIAGKMFELYRKHALYLLRTKGYIEFDEFLRKYHDKSNQYPHRKIIYRKLLELIYQDQKLIIV